ESSSSPRTAISACGSTIVPPAMARTSPMSLLRFRRSALQPVGAFTLRLITPQLLVDLPLLLRAQGEPVTLPELLRGDVAVQPVRPPDLLGHGLGRRLRRLADVLGLAHEQLLRHAHLRVQLSREAPGEIAGDPAGLQRRAVRISNPATRSGHQPEVWCGAGAGRLLKLLGE